MLCGALTPSSSRPLASVVRVASAQAGAKGRHLGVVGEHPAVAVEHVELGGELAEVGVHAVRAAPLHGLEHDEREPRERAHQVALEGADRDLAEGRRRGAGGRRPRSPPSLSAARLRSTLQMRAWAYCT